MNPSDPVAESAVPQADFLAECWAVAEPDRSVPHGSTTEPNRSGTERNPTLGFRYNPSATGVSVLRNPESPKGDATNRDRAIGRAAARAAAARDYGDGLEDLDGLMAEAQRVLLWVEVIPDLERRSTLLSDFDQMLVETPGGRFTYELRPRKSSKHSVKCAAHNSS